MLSPHFGQRSRDLADRGSAADGIDDQRDQRGPLVPRAIVTVTSRAGAERIESGRYRLLITPRSGRAHALDLLAFQARVIRRRYIRRIPSVAEAVHADNHRLAALNAELELVRAPRDLFLEEAGGDRSGRAAHVIDAREQRAGLFLELAR